LDVEILWRSPAPYAATWQWQRERAAAVAAGKARETLLLVEHPPVYTLGPRSDPTHLLASEEQLRALGAEVHWIDRGGDVTWHGPGQLVGYPILDLNRRRRDLHAYVYALEQVLIDVAAQVGVGAGRVAGMTGVWVADQKLAAIGIKLGRGWVTYHGFALNVSADLRWFERIVPCGLHERGVTSLSRSLGRDVPVDEARRLTVHAFLNVFGGERARQTADAAALRRGLAGVQSPRAGGESDHVGSVRAS
jgi:lipoyl(octanoyl) transferase